MTFKHDGGRNATFGVRTRRRSKRDVRRSKLRTAVYPPRMAPIGLKLWEHAFQVIPNISFFDGTNIFCDNEKIYRFFVRPFTPRGWLRSARNFAKTRFRRFPTFGFSTPKKNFRRKFRIENFRFCQFGVDFDEVRRNGRQNQLQGQILLQIDLS